MCEIFLISDILLTMSSSAAETAGSDDNTAADTKWTQLRKGQCSDVVVSKDGKEVIDASAAVACSSCDAS